MSKEKNNSLKYLKAFLLIVLLFILIGSVVKIINQYNERSFTQNTYNLLVISDKYVGVLGLDDNDKRFSAALVTKGLENVKRENIMLQSINLGIPIHGYLSYPEGVEAKAPTRDFFSLGNLQNIIMDTRIKKKSVSLFDWIKLYFLAGEVDEDNVKINSYAEIEDLRGLIESEDEEYFRDSDISNRKTSLQVINATSINGIGGRVGEMYSRIGFNVVSIISEKGLDDSQIVYSEEEFKNDATIIQKSFDFPIVQNEEYQLADVTLIIGEESELVLENLAN